MNDINNPLIDLDQTIRKHWLRYRPQMVAELEKAGMLETAIQTAVSNTEEDVLALTTRGVHLWEAWMQVRERWAILPSEEDRPELASHPMTWEIHEEDADAGDL